MSYFCVRIIMTLCIKDDRLFALKSFLVAACYNENFPLLCCSFHGRVRLPNLRKLSLLKCWEADELSSGALFALPPPEPLDIHGSNAAEKWKECEQAWRNYSVDMKLHQEPKVVQIATLLTVIEEPKLEFFSPRLR